MKRTIEAAITTERERILLELAQAMKVWCEGHETRLVSYETVQRIVVDIPEDRYRAVQVAGDRLAL